MKIGVSGASGHLGKEEEPSGGASYWRGEQHLIATAPA